LQSPLKSWSKNDLSFIFFKTQLSFFYLEEDAEFFGIVTSINVEFNLENFCKKDKVKRFMFVDINEKQNFSPFLSVCIILLLKCWSFKYGSFKNSSILPKKV